MSPLEYAGLSQLDYEALLREAEEVVAPVPARSKNIDLLPPQSPDRLPTVPVLYTPPKKIFDQEHVVQLAYADNLPQSYVLPEELWWVGYYTAIQLDALEEHPEYFHGTRQSRIQGILADGGLKKHFEPGVRERLHSVYATPDPVIAAFHAYRNGPEDAANPSWDKRDASDPVVILKLNIDEYPSEQMEEYKHTARLTYRAIRNGGKGSYVGEQMGDFVPLKMLSVLVPGENGVREVGIEALE